MGSPRLRPPRRVLAYDTTNFHTWIATTNLRNQLAQRGHSKQKRDELPACLGRITRLLDGAGLPRESVTLVMDKGSAAEQFQSVGTSLAKATQKLRALAREVSQPQDRHTEQGLRGRIQRWLQPNFVAQALSYELRRAADRSWELQFAVDTDALHRLLAERFGRTTLVTNRLDWTPAQVAVAYNGQQHVERVFRGLKGGQWLGWGPLHHWTDSKIRVHAF